MLSREPLITVGIVEHAKELHGAFNGPTEVRAVGLLDGEFTVREEFGRLVMRDASGTERAAGPEIVCRSDGGSTFTLRGVTIGINFHWERQEDQTFEGNLRILLAPDGMITAINEVSVELYLKSVISSEMSAEAPIELLRAHAITSRSWLVAMLERQKTFKNAGVPARRSLESPNEIVRWYDREDHTLFDVCADDHCQRYQGITKIISPAADQAVRDTRGMFLVANDEICDARFYKACGGRTELFENAWEDTPIPYLRSVVDAAADHPAVGSEKAAEQWMLSSPDAYCNTTDGRILRQVLPSFDQETTDFYRWKVAYTQAELHDVLLKKSGIDFGTVAGLEPLHRGPSGRITRLKITGSKRVMIVGKELEIRRWLSKSHLYSSAFIVKTETDASGVPTMFTLHGAGWGHGVGLCQIGAAVMAARGFSADAIVKHYFHGADVRTLY